MNPSEPFLPDFCSLRTTLMLVVSSLLLAFVLTLADFSPDYGFWTDLSLRAFFIIWIVLLSGAVLCGLRSRLIRLGPMQGGIATFLLVQTVALVAAAVAQSGLVGVKLGLPAERDPAGFGLRVLAASSLITAAWLRYQYVQSRWRLQSRAEVSARLDALQARMQQHFLFNSLNAIAGLVRENPAKAEDLVLDMADVLRAILRKDARLVRLSEEIGLTRQYLHIEQQRLGDRLEVAWDVNAAPQDALIPPLSLQPLVENAIRHGIEKLSQGGRIAIAVRLTGKGLVLTVSNTLPESESLGKRSGNRAAVANLRARLEACFQDRARFYTSVVDGCYQVRIVMPYQVHAHESADR
jgi:two-component system sensor histidine kinase AlgZ